MSTTFVFLKCVKETCTLFSKVSVYINLEVCEGGLGYYMCRSELHTSESNETKLFLP